MAQYVLDLPELLEKDEETMLNQIAWAGMKYPEFDKPIITPFVVPTVLASLWAVVKNLDSWSAAVASAIKLGGDVDTLGAIVGGLMGARLGIDAIPSRLIEQVVESNHLWQLAEKYYNLICDKPHSHTVLRVYGC